MQQRKCKNAVWNGLFLLIFSLGAICGAFLVRIIALGEVLAVGMIPGGYRLLPVLVFLRGCLTAYAAAACYVTGSSPAFVIFRGLLLLPLFYYFCRWVYTMQAPGLSAGQTGTH